MKISIALFHKTPAKFESNFSLADSVERLSATVKSSPIRSALKETLVGRVKSDKVRISRYRPRRGNSFKPYFHGKFKIVDGATVLSGYFSIHSMVKIIMSIIYIFMILFAVLAFLSSLGEESVLEGLKSAIGGLIALVIPELFVRFGQWYSRGDLEFISEIIASSLTPNDA